MSGADEALLAVLEALPRGAEVAVVRRDGEWVVGTGPDDVVVAHGTGAFGLLDGLRSGWWAGFLSYDLGRAVERVEARLPDELGLPDLCLARFDARLVVSAAGLRVEGRGRGRAGLRALARRTESGGGRGRRGGGSPELGGWRSSVDRPGYEAAARAVLELIAAGDCFQVNLARRLTCGRRADPVDLFASLVRFNPAPHAALWSVGGVAVVSGSPERFLWRDGSLVQTRPIKGTSADGAVLAASAKDRAENVMIVDLVRNDLGRVCEYASVSVTELCRVERHPGLYHLVSTVEGRLRPGVGSGALVRATFPPASVTGAPKPRVLQAIEDLEACRRGVYCGAVGWVDADAGLLDLNVAIRTFVVAGGETYLGVGAGIVADSDPGAEWAETELKAARLLAAAAATGSRARSSA